MAKLIEEFSLRGTFADLPTDNDPSKAGRFYTTDDTNQFFRDNGTTWDEVIVVGDGGSISVDDGGSPIDPTTSITFLGAGVTDLGSGHAQVTISSGTAPKIQSLAEDAMSLASATPTNMILNPLEGDVGLTELFDQSDPEHIVALSGAVGAWELQAFATVNCASGGSIGSIVACIIYVNGSPIARSSRAMDGNTSTEVVTFPRRVVLADTDDITVMVEQASIFSVDLHSSTTDAWSGLILTKVG